MDGSRQRHYTLTYQLHREKANPPRFPATSAAWFLCKRGSEATISSMKRNRSAEEDVTKPSVLFRRVASRSLLILSAIFAAVAAQAATIPVDVGPGGSF